MCACDGECSCMFCIVCTVMLTEIDFSAKCVCMFYFALCLNLFFFHSVCRVRFTCMLYQYVLGVRMHVLCVCMFMVSVAT